MCHIFPWIMLKINKHDLWTYKNCFFFFFRESESKKVLPLAFADSSPSKSTRSQRALARSKSSHGATSLTAPSKKAGPPYLKLRQIQHEDCEYMSCRCRICSFVWSLLITPLCWHYSCPSTIYGTDDLILHKPIADSWLSGCSMKEFHPPIPSGAF